MLLNRAAATDRHRLALLRPQPALSWARTPVQLLWLSSWHCDSSLPGAILALGRRRGAHSQADYTCFFPLNKPSKAETIEVIGFFGRKAIDIVSMSANFHSIAAIFSGVLEKYIVLNLM